MFKFLRGRSGKEAGEVEQSSIVGNTREAATAVLEMGQDQRKNYPELSPEAEMTPQQIACLSVDEYRSYLANLNLFRQGFYKSSDRARAARDERELQRTLRSIAELAKHLEKGGDRKSFQKINWSMYLPENLKQS